MIALFVAVSGLVPLMAETGSGTGAAAPAVVLTLPIGTGDAQVSVAIATDGQILDGPLQGPAAVCALGERFVIADTLAARVLIVNRTGKIESVIPLAPLVKTAGLATTPAIVDVTPVGSAPTTLAIADAANTCVLIVGLDGHWRQTLGQPKTGPGNLQAVNRVQADNGGRVVVEDLAARRAVVFTSDGKHAGDLPEAITIAVDTAGRIMQPVFRGQSQSRDLCLLDDKGQPGFTFGQASEVVDINLIRPLGAMANGEWLIWYSTATDDVVAAFDDQGKRRDLWRGSLPASIEMTTPLFADRQGRIFAVEVTPPSWRILQLSR